MSASGKAIQLFPANGSARKVGKFLWHFLQMVLAMVAGMMVYHLLEVRALDGTGFSALTGRFPLAGYWMMVLFMVLGMVVLMCFHRATWRYSLAMSLAMVAPLAVLTVLVLCSWLPVHTLYVVGDPLMLVAMAGFMLYRPSGHSHHEHAEARHTA